MRKTSYLFIFTCLLLIAFPLDGFPAQLTGKVVQIYSGDTIEILAGQSNVRIHLYGIDCPTNEQAFAKEAKEYTSQLAYGKVVTVHITNTDRRSGKIGTVMLPGGMSLNCELVKAGLAWWNQDIAPDDRILQALEKSAKSNRLGLWVVSDPVPPWENNRKNINDSASQPEPNTPPVAFNDDTTVYVTSTGEKYHRHGCRYLVNSMIPLSLGEARTSGLVPCPTCGPPK